MSRPLTSHNQNVTHIHAQYLLSCENNLLLHLTIEYCSSRYYFSCWLGQLLWFLFTVFVRYRFGTSVWYQDHVWWLHFGLSCQEWQEWPVVLCSFLMACWHLHRVRYQLAGSARDFGWARCYSLCAPMEALLYPPGAKQGHGFHGELLVIEPF